MKRLMCVPAALLFLLTACQQGGPIDLEALEGKARGGDPTAFRELVSLLSNAENDVNSRVYAMLLDLGSVAVPHLLEGLPGADRERREHVIAALGTLKAREGVEPIARLLGDRTLGRRYVAAWALGEIGDERGVAPLVAALDDEDDEVRKYATRSLIKLNRAAVMPLVAYLEKAPPRGEAGAVRALGDIGDRRALQPLLARVSGQSRADVFLALGKLRAPEAEATLIAGLADPDWQVRMNAAMALGPLGSKGAVATLEKTLEDEVHVVREWSARSLEMITGRHITYRNDRGEYVAPYNLYH